MKKYMILSITAIIVIGIIFIFAAKSSSRNEFGTLTKDFMTMYSQSKDSILVDVRTKDEFNSGHIKDAVNVDFYNPAFVEKMKALGTGKNFFIYCRSGNRSGQALSMLASVGVIAEHLEGGISAHPELLQ